LSPRGGDEPLVALPVIRTERLVLRERTLDDLELCVSMDNDPEVRRFIVLPMQGDMHRSFIRGRIMHRYPEHLGYWTVLAEGKFAGWVLLIPRELEGPEIEIGWRFVAEARGKGYATEAAAAVLRHALTTAGLTDVVADIDPENTASRRVAEKLGMHHAKTWLESGRPTMRYLASASNKSRAV
jgi:RimJ/RimL family protein N-acetyltransferase